MGGDSVLNKLIAGFTNDGTPLSATIGSKMEHGVVILTAAMLANTNLAASMDPEEMVDSAIHYYNIIQKRLGYYQEHQAHSLERLLGNWIPAKVSKSLLLEMEPISVPKLTVSFAVDVEVSYNSFGGKTAEDISEALQDELHDLLFELDQVTGVYTTCTSIASYDWSWWTLITLPAGT